jgi:hypothetical protein
MTLIDWNIFLSHLSDVSDWLPFLVWLWLPRSNRMPYLGLGAYLLVNSCLKTTTLVLLQRHGMYNTLPFYHVLAVAEVILLTAFLSRRYAIPGQWLWMALAVVVVVNVCNSFFVQPGSFNSNAWMINTVFLTATALLALFRLFTETTDVEFERSPPFIILTALLLYFSGSLFLYGVSVEVLSQEAKDFFGNAWIIRSVADILKSILLTYGIWLAKRT